MKLKLSKKAMKFSLVALVGSMSLNPLFAETFKLESPDKKLSISFNCEEKVSYDVSAQGLSIIKDAPISITIDGTKYPAVNSNVTMTTSSSDKFVVPQVKTINNSFHENYNALTLAFGNNLQLEARAYDEGVAFRWKTNFNKETILVNNEQNELKFTKGFSIYYPQLDGKNFISNQENVYHYFKNMNDMKGKLAKLRVPVPMLVNVNDNLKMLISEANLESYPGWYIKKDLTQENSFKSAYPAYPKGFKARGVRSTVPKQRENYIAKVAGKRALPWRAYLISSDTDMMVNQLIYKLSDPSRVKDCSWIKPGKVSWDWWHAWNIPGVNFKSGINTQTYKFYIDFAAKSKSKYIILDAGWSKKVDHKETLLDVVDAVDIPEIVRYGKERGVGVILWTTAWALDYNFDKAFKQFSEWGIAGLKIDYLVRDDQTMVEFVYKVMQKAAENKLIIDFHGGYKPTGVSRTYPNFMTCESVKGLEQSKWSKKADPNYNTLLPFIRNVVGPMDYTPGAMQNSHLKDFKDNFKSPGSIGTRCQQLGMYVVYFSSIQMLSDAPTRYYAAPLAMEFLTEVPTVWDKSLGIEGKVGKFAAVARRDGNRWFIGGINNYDARELTIKLDFLTQGQTYQLKLYKDGKDIEEDATSVELQTVNVKYNDTIKVKMATGGGFAGILTPVK
ncbi:glycoside hydrolase family 97 catalytic domain-containing protein [Lentisphaerota bacterium WC36G]|nr:glycoside hydrolase family 97 protein [Lentisphaerae bacterium WC36]